MQEHRESKRQKLVWHEVLFRGVIWSLVGALYAAVFIPVFEVGGSTLPVWLALVLASIAATAGGALVYSSAQLAFQVAVVSNVAVFGYTLVSGGAISPLEPVVVGAGAGAVVGALYGLIVKKSSIYRADAKLLSGIVAGGGLSVLGIAWVMQFEGNPIFLVALLAPLSGVIYERIVNKFVQRFSDLLPPFADGAVAGVVIGGLLGLGLWVMGGAVLENVAAEWLTTINRIAYSAPLAIVAAAVTTFVVGMVDKVVSRG
jgi:hypothetical protein